MSYTIQPYTRKRAKELGVEVRPSDTGHKKVDVLKGGVVVASIGDNRYADYPTYKQLEKDGEVAHGTAEKRRKAYHARHGQYPKKVAGKYTAGFLAGELLW